MEKFIFNPFVKSIDKTGKSTEEYHEVILLQWETKFELVNFKTKKSIDTYYINNDKEDNEHQTKYEKILCVNFNWNEFYSDPPNKEGKIPSEREKENKCFVALKIKDKNKIDYKNIYDIEDH